MFSNAAQFRSAHPGLFFLDPEDLPSLETYQRSRGVLTEGDAILAACRAGDGNMNCTVRVTTRGGSCIVKQARPWVEKYPQFGFFGRPEFDVAVFLAHLWRRSSRSRLSGRREWWSRSCFPA